MRRLSAILDFMRPRAPLLASAEQLALVAMALRNARVAPDVAAAGFLWAAKDERRALKLVAELGRR